MDQKLKKIIFECIASKLNEWDSPVNANKKNFVEIEAVELENYAKSRGYKGPMINLFDAAANIYIRNENGEFEENVVKPLKRKQGIYY